MTETDPEVRPGLLRWRTATDSEVVACATWEEAAKAVHQEPGAWMNTQVVAIDADGRAHNAHPYLEGPSGRERVIWHCTCGARSTGRYDGPSAAITAAELEHPIGRIPWRRTR